MVKTTALVMLSLMLAAAAAGAGTVAPGLADRLGAMDGDDLVTVLVVLKDQADIPRLDADLRAAKSTRAERHAAVMDALHGAARRSQKGLLDSLAADKADGGIVGWTPHWIINAVVVRGAVDAVVRLADHPDVEILEPNLVAEPVEPMLIKDAAPPADAGKNKAGFVTNSVRVIGADRVWHELGITGAGAIVANMDSGVDGTHPALASRWRGNIVAASAAWNDAGGTGSSTPVDNVGHGTHVMGTITGATAFDTLGVAPGARWIASNAVYGTAETLDNQILAAFEWLADPDGDPSTSDDVPDVCHNSWGVNPNFGYPDCFSYWWNVIDNCEAAGVVVTFSAGNEGPGAGTLRSPGNRADSPTNCFTIGSTSQNSPYTVSYFSSRGPSQCPGPYPIKPEVMAPGENIYSTLPGGSYGYMDGTSMAGPHVAGVVALMRQAAPDLDVTTIKELLMSTAMDLGVPGEDNSYGHGMVDAYAAVTAVLGNTGRVEGVITDQATGLPLAGVAVRDMRGMATATTAADGSFGFTILGGATTLRCSLFGYETVLQDVTIPAGGALDASAALVPMAPAVVSGTVRGPGGVPVAGAEVSAQGTPVAPVQSGPDGTYALTLPSGLEAGYELLAVAPGLAYGLVTVGLQSARTVDFDLPLPSSDGFESGSFTTLPWQVSGATPWTVSSDQAYEGVLSARSGVIGHSGSSELILDFYVNGDGPCSFMVRTDSEITYDRLQFWLDGEIEGTWSGATAWTPWTGELATGWHSLRWVYSKDSSVSVGADAAWIDILQLPGTGVQPLAALTLDAASLDVTLDAGTFTTLPLRIGNAGDATLTWRAAPAGDDGDAAVWMSATPDSGVVYPGSVHGFDVVLDARHTAAGVHEGMLVITSNDAAHPDTAIAVTLTINGVTGVGGDLPSRPVLAGAVPNPFNPTTVLRYSLPAAAQVDLRIYDVSGRLVRSLVSGARPAGHHAEPWDGRDDAGRAAASGVYYARLAAAGETSIKPMTLVR